LHQHLTHPNDITIEDRIVNHNVVHGDTTVLLLMELPFLQCSAISLVSLSASWCVCTGSLKTLLTPQTGRWLITGTPAYYSLRGYYGILQVMSLPWYYVKQDRTGLCAPTSMAHHTSTRTAVRSQTMFFSTGSMRESGRPLQQWVRSQKLSSPDTRRTHELE
jgi:hypothetical protein